jgi:hypothetical protein
VRSPNETENNFAALVRLERFGASLVILRSRLLRSFNAWALYPSRNTGSASYCWAVHADRVRCRTPFHLLLPKTTLVGLALYLHHGWGVGG